MNRVWGNRNAHRKEVVIVNKMSKASIIEMVAM